MPYRKKTNRKKRYRRKRQAKTGAPITGPPKMTRALRVHQNLTRDCRYFKFIERISSNTSGNFFNVFTPLEVNLCNDFTNWGRCWEEFKVLSIKVKLQPVAIGSESLGSSANPAFKRGLTLTWLDQGEPDPTFTDVDNIIVRPSCRTVTPRYPHYRWASRPRGNPEWGKLNAQGGIEEADSWSDTRIRLWGQDYTPITTAGQQTWFFATIYYKVLFRGRQQYTAPTIEATNLRDSPVPSPR